MSHCQRSQPASQDPRRRAEAEAPPAGARPYAAPRLRRLGHTGELLEVLGPAQAAYGDPGP
jgi:hypothetical protein